MGAMAKKNKEQDGFLISAREAAADEEGPVNNLVTMANKLVVNGDLQRVHILVKHNTGEIETFEFPTFI